MRYVPIDLPGAVRRFFQRVQPQLAVILETEIWPNLYHRCGRLGVPLVLASARISPRSVNSYRRLVGLFRETLSHGIFIAAQSAEDARAIPFHRREPGAHARGRQHQVRLRLSARHRSARARAAAPARRAPPGVGGGQHACEGRRRAARRASRWCASASPTRCWCWCRGIRRASPKSRARCASRACASSRAPAAPALTAETEVFLLDTLGELPAFYAAGDVAFVGGSLVPIGGHNLLEPAALGLPIAGGAAQLQFRRHRAAAGRARRGAHRARRGAACRRSIGELLADPAARTAMGASGRKAVDDNRGAVARLMAVPRAAAALD